jgi:hypothetical protein
VSGALAFAAGTHSDRRFASVFVTAPDGLRLHIRSYGSRVASALPVVCLPALARTAADFHPLAEALAADPGKPRLVLAVDYRGHGQSEYDCNPDNYTLPVALADLSAVLIALERPGHIRRHLLRRHRRHAASTRAAHGYCRCPPQRHRPCHRAAGLGANQTICGKAPRPAYLSGWCGNPTLVARRAVPEARTGRLDRLCPAHLARARRPARSLSPQRCTPATRPSGPDK